MLSSVSKRFVWSTAILNVQSDDSILEIGCGHGTAVALIASKFESGSLTAIDQSPKMIEKAQRRNDMFVRQGKVKFLTTTLSDAELLQSTYNKIFAINVNVFWLKPKDEFEVIRRAIHPSGLLYLFYEPPTAGKIPSMITKLTKNLELAGFTMVDTIVEDNDVCMFGVLAQR